MRSRRTMRRSRPLNLAAGALILTVPTAAAALAATQADAQSAMQIDVSSDHVGYDHHVTVNGSAPANDAGQSVALEFARAGSSRWQPIASTKVGTGGRFHFRESLRKSGSLRAALSGGGSFSGGLIRNAATATAPSASQQVTVSSEFQIRRRSIELLDGQAAYVRGRLLPGVAGRKVRLEGISHGRWHVVGSARTGGRGHFQIRYRPGYGTGGATGQPLRVVFRGDRLNTHAGRAAGRVTVFVQSVASWYDDAGNTACGFHAGLGVANKSLPCGTKVTFRYGGRTVTAVVDDRGPYVGGRTWDLNQSTASALGFGGVGTVWSTS